MYNQAEERTLSKVCPCCGQPFEPLHIVVDLNTNTFVFGQRRVKMTPQLAVFMHTLISGSPSIVPDVDFSYALYGLLQPPLLNLSRVLATYASCARRIIGSAGIIERTHSRGYRYIEGAQYENAHRTRNAARTGNLRGRPRVLSD